MSLIEKALNKASKQIKSNSYGDGALPVVDPNNIVAPSPARKNVWLLTLGGLFFFIVLMLSIFFFLSQKILPPPSTMVNPKVNHVPSPPSPSISTGADLAVTPSAKTDSNNVRKAAIAGKKIQEESASPPLSTSPNDLPFMAKPALPEEPNQYPAAKKIHAPPDNLLPENRINNLLNKAYAYGETGKNAEALQCYNEILSLSPQHYEALLNPGIIKQRMKNLEGAEKDLLVAFQMHPDDLILLNSLGVFYLEKGDEEKARTFLLNAGDATALINLALLYWEKRDWENVISSLQEAKKRDTQNPYAPYYLGLLYLQTGNSAFAYEELEKAVSIAKKRGLIDLIRTIESLSLGY